jgi:two-component system, NarL family, response regulator LiaR
VVAGLAALLLPYSEQIQVVDMPIRGDSVAAPVDIALFDTFGHPNNGSDEIHRLNVDRNVDRIAIFTWQFDSASVASALQAGVRGYLGKNMSADQLVDSLQRIDAGELVVSEDPLTDHTSSPKRDWPGKSFALSEREAEVLVLVAEGLSNAEIAKRLFISPNSLKTHIRNGYRKLNVATRSQAVRAVLDRNMIRRMSM